MLAATVTTEGCREVLMTLAPLCCGMLRLRVYLQSTEIVKAPAGQHTWACP